MTVNLNVSGNSLEATNAATGQAVTEVGVQGEDGAVVLHADVPEDWADLTVKLQLIAEDGTFDESDAAVTKTVGGVTSTALDMPIRRGVTVPGRLTAILVGTDGAGIRLTADCVLTIAPSESSSSPMLKFYPQDFKTLQAGFDAIATKRKLGENGNFTGTWNGCEMHLSQEGLASDWAAAKGGYGAVAGRLDGICLDVTNFGAVRDGAADNAAAFQQVSNYVNQSDGDISVFFPDGVYVYSGGLSFIKPVKLYSNGGAVLRYTGTGRAVTFSAAYNANGTPKNGYFQRAAVEDLTFSSGASMTAGLFFDSFITVARLKGVRFINFGNASAYGVWFSKNNWDCLMLDCSFFADDSDGPVTRNWVRISGDSGVDANSAFNSRLRMQSCLGTDIGTAAKGVGVWLDGINDEISDCKIEGFNPDVRLGCYASCCVVAHNYFEGTGSACVEFGSKGYNEGYYVDNLLLDGNYANVHNTDLNSSTVFLAPSTTSAGLTNAVVQNNILLSLSPAREMIRLNNLVQRGNAAGNNAGFGVLRTTGANITRWGGPQGEYPVYKNGVEDSNFLGVQAGRSAVQYCGLNLLDYAGNALDTLQTSANNMFELIHRGSLALQIDQSGTVSAPARFKAGEQYVFNAGMNPNLAWANSLFVDTTDGKLKFRDAGGTVNALY